MSKVDRRLAQFRSEGRKALVPFLTAGDPSLQVTCELIRAFDRMGCGVCEVGIPYSDPIADGPVIQASYTRALDRKIRVEEIFDQLATVAPQIEMPVVVMVSYAIVYRMGLQAFVERAISAGVSGAIIPDLLVEDADEMDAICRARDFSLIRLVTPTTPDDRAAAIARSSTGFVYYVSVTGITGERVELPPEISNRIQWLQQQTAVPICVGFGISTPSQASLMAKVADGVIVGSAIVRRLAPAADGSVKPSECMVADVESFVGELLEGLSD